MLPSDTSEIAAVLRWANANLAPVVPGPGAGTGLSGRAAAVEVFVVLSTAKLNTMKKALDPLDILNPGKVLI